MVTERLETATLSFTAQPLNTTLPRKGFEVPEGESKLMRPGPLLEFDTAKVWLNEAR